MRLIAASRSVLDNDNMAKSFSAAAKGWRKHFWLLYYFPNLEEGLQTSDAEIAEARQFFWKVTVGVGALMVLLALAGAQATAFLIGAAAFFLQAAAYDSLKPLAGAGCGEMLDLAEAHPEIEHYRQQVLSEVRQFRQVDLMVAKSSSRRLAEAAKCRALYLR